MGRLAKVITKESTEILAPPSKGSLQQAKIKLRISQCLNRLPHTLDLVAKEFVMLNDETDVYQMKET